MCQQVNMFMETMIHSKEVVENCPNDSETIILTSKTKKALGQQKNYDKELESLLNED